MKQFRTKYSWASLLTLLAVIMHMAVLVKPLWVNALQGGSAVQICSGADILTIYIDEDGNRTPAPPEMRIHDCAMCMGASMVALNSAADNTTLSHPDIYSAPLPPNGFDSTRETVRGTHQSRAPPAVS